MVWWKKAKATENAGEVSDAEAQDAEQVQSAQAQSVEAEDAGETAPAEESTEVVEAVENVEAGDSVEAAGNVEAEDSVEAVETEEAQPVEETVGLDESAAVDESASTEEAAESAEASNQTADAGSAEISESPTVDETAVPADAEATQVLTEDVPTDIADEASTVEQPVENVQESAPMDEDSFAPDFTAPPGTSLTGADAEVTQVSDSADVPVVPLKKTISRTGNGLRNTVLTVVGSVLGAVLLVVGCGALGTSYFDDHAKPGAELAGRDITGFSMTQVRNVAATLIENYTANLELGDKQAYATSSELGITFDLDKTVDAAMGAGSTAAVSDRYNPFNTKKALLVMSVDEEKLQTYLNATFISDDQRSVPAEVAYDADQGGFTVTPGTNGTEADAAAVAQELKDGKGISEALAVATTSEPPRITDDTAQQTADAANQLLATSYTVTAGSKSYTFSADSIASWVTFTSDQDAGTIQMGINTDQATADIPGILADNLSQPVVPQQTLYSPDGRRLGVQKSGVAGTEVADPDGVTAQIVQALVDGSGMDATVATKATPFTEEQVTIGDGVKWVEVNRSNYTVTRWEGGTQLSTWSVVIGKPSTPTYPGIFHVWAKVANQTMKGPDYVQPNVPWVAYFDGDRALHGNYWVGSFGWGSSHGCVGMPVAQAQIMYDWINIGTLVVVHD